MEYLGEYPDMIQAHIELHHHYNTVSEYDHGMSLRCALSSLEFCPQEREEFGEDEPTKDTNTVPFSSYNVLDGMTETYCDLFPKATFQEVERYREGIRKALCLQSNSNNLSNVANVAMWAFRDLEEEQKEEIRASRHL